MIPWAKCFSFQGNGISQGKEAWSITGCEPRILVATRKPLRSLSGSLQDYCESGFEAERRATEYKACCMHKGMMLNSLWGLRASSRQPAGG